MEETIGANVTMSAGSSIVLYQKEIRSSAVDGL